jgi:DNA recombination protein RmuC
MDINIWVVVGFKVGLVLGYLIAHLRGNHRVRRARADTRRDVAEELAQVRADFEQQLAVQAEQLTQREQTIDKLEAQLGALSTKVEEHLAALQEQGAAQRAAEEKASRIPALEEDINALRNTKDELERELTDARARMEEERKAAREKLELVEKAREELTGAFKVLSQETLEKSNASFLELARETLGKYQEKAIGDLDKRQEAIGGLVKPLHDALGKVDKQLRELETERVGAYKELRQQVRSLLETETSLREETANLVKALRAPQVRGRWGEIQLKRVVEIAGMLTYCDFLEQESVTMEDGRLRPDMIVRLPGGKRIIIDAKAPLEAYLNAVESKDTDRQAEQLARHAEQIRGHMAKLGSKGYWSQFDDTPEFVVMFLPGEVFFSSALQSDPRLIEEGFKHKVIPASPTTLLALLRAVAYGWQQERITENARQISELGREMHERIAVVLEHLQQMGRRLSGTVEFYNKAVRSIDSRLLTSARRFEELGTGSGKELTPPEPLDHIPELPGPAEPG